MEDVLENILDHYQPYTVFLYGSRATGNGNSNSDYEIGVVFEDEKYKSRKDLAGIVDDKNFSIYPFRLSEMMNCKIDTPFQKNVFMSVLAQGGAKILYGKNIFEEIAIPKLKKEDLMEDIYFNLGIALASIRIFRDGVKDLAKDMFYKSCLYATRDFLYLKTNRLSVSYKETSELAGIHKELLGDYYDLIKLAYELREDEHLEVPIDALYKNVSYINKFVLERI